MLLYITVECIGKVGYRACGGIRDSRWAVGRIPGREKGTAVAYKMDICSWGGGWERRCISSCQYGDGGWESKLLLGSCIEGLDTEGCTLVGCEGFIQQGALLGVGLGRQALVYLGAGEMSRFGLYIVTD